MIKSRKRAFVASATLAVMSAAAFGIMSFQSVRALPFVDKANPNAIVNAVAHDDNDDNEGRKNANERAEKALKKQRENRAVLSAENRKTVCENRQNAIQNKVRAMGGAARANMTHLDTAREKLDAYISKNQPVGVNIATTETAQTAAKTAVASLEAVSGESMNCEANDPAKWVYEVRYKAETAREALKVYRSELKAIVTTLKQQSPTASNSSNEDSRPTTGTTEENN